MGTVTKTFEFSSGATIFASEHNSNFDTIYNEFNGNISNTNIDAAAAIANSKLNLASIAQAVDFQGAVDISSTFNFGTTNQGDVLYDNGTSIVRLTPGTNGQLLETAGAAANPTWTSLAGDVSGTVDANTVTDLTITSEAQGDVLYNNGSNWVRLAAGTDGQFLQTKGSSANPQWTGSAMAFDSSDTFSGSSNVSITRTMSTGEIFFVVFEGTASATDGVFGFRVNGATTNYPWIINFLGLGFGTSTIESATNGDSIRILGANGLRQNFMLQAYIYVRTSDTHLQFTTSTQGDTDDVGHATGAGFYDAATPTAISLARISGTATISGRSYVYLLNTA